MIRSLIRMEEEVIGEHTFTAEDIIAFAGRYDPQPFHTDAEAAKQTVFGGLCASGWHTVALWMRFNVLSLQAEAEEARKLGKPVLEWGPSPGIRNLVWHRPAFAGDTFTYRRKVEGIRAASNLPGWTILTITGGASNQHGLDALSFSSGVLCRLPD